MAVKNGYLKQLNDRAGISYEVTDKGHAFLESFKHLEKEMPADPRELPHWVRFEGDVYHPRKNGYFQPQSGRENSYKYGEWTQKLRLTHKAVAEKGGRTKLSIDPPASEEEIVQVEKRLKQGLPESFRRVLLQYSRKVYFYWALDESRGIETSCGFISGGGFFDHGLWDLGQLIHFDRCRKDNEYLDEYEPDPLWAHSFVFALNGMGDCLGIDMKYNIGEVVYLPHEREYSGWRLGRSFESFMENWIHIGCSGLFVKEWAGFQAADAPYIDHRSENAAPVKKQLGLAES
ncbi:SMI1/KNR4 family protein [Paenibacillus hamazuiensis]|uniref:SMI1/KNR4 family protein n=1 Tax=Paenibacillus hamazuiensis TaxID=2936508 RepID=UPI00200F11C1|nr:SMI1/KNR4 family protein [Paenibacillus hamazuiensis]